MTKKVESQEVSNNLFEIELSNTAEDLIAWNNYLLAHNINNAQYRLILSASLPALAGGIVGFIQALVRNYADLSERLIASVMVFVVTFLLVGLIFTYPFYLYLLYLMNRRLKYQAKNTKGFLQPRRMEFGTEQIKIYTEHSNSQYDYGLFTGCLENEEYLFLQLTPVQAYILPKKYFTKEQIEFIKHKIMR